MVMKMRFSELYFSSRLKKTTVYNLIIHCTISIVKKDIKSPGLHDGWHLQIKLIFYTQNKERNLKTTMQYTKQTTQQQSQGRLVVKEIRAFQLVAVKQEQDIAVHGLSIDISMGLSQ